MYKILVGEKVKVRKIETRQAMSCITQSSRPTFVENRK
jgi:hypothetical protein